MTMDWETISDELIDQAFRWEIDDILGDMRKNALATRGDAIAVRRMEQAMRETGEWPKWPEEYYEEWVFFWKDCPESAIEHSHGHEVDEILKDLRTVEPNATRKDAIEEWRNDHIQKAIEVADEVDRKKRRNDRAMIAQRQAAIYAVMANKDDAGE
jgi:phage pi2 protein 07